MTEQMNNEKYNKNVPLSPIIISEDGQVTCMNCGGTFIRAKRCTLCGQLILYPGETKETKSKEGSSFEFNKVNSGKGIYKYLQEFGNWDLSSNALDSSDNYIIIKPYNISFNWKKKRGQIRVNCKKEEMQWIETRTGLKHIDNSSDPVHPYSFLLNTFDEFENVVKAIKQI